MNLLNQWIYLLQLHNLKKILLHDYDNNVKSYSTIQAPEFDQQDLEEIQPWFSERTTDDPATAELLPVVIMHGMGDAAANSGMQSIRQAISRRLNGSYVVNIAIGNDSRADTSNGFFMTMDDQVSEFARVIQQDVRLSQGFHAVGLSQGNLLIRAYVQRYNTPKVHTFVSIHGPLAGVGALPLCHPDQMLCRHINHWILRAAYASFTQNRLAQANYYRSPTDIPTYETKALFLPDINNEGPHHTPSYKDKFSSLEKLVLVRANQDTMVFPKDSAWFGAYEDCGSERNTRSCSYDVLSMNETKWYRRDSFGLRTLSKQNRIKFLETEGNHLDFSLQDLLHWVDTFFTPY